MFLIFLLNVSLNIHYLKTEDIVLGYKIYDSIVNSIDKNDFIMLVIKSRLDGKQHTIKVDTMKEMTQAIKQYI